MMTEVQKAYLLGRNETFRGKTGTHIYLELEFTGDMRRLNEAFNELIINQPMLRASVLDLQSFQINPPFTMIFLLSTQPAAARNIRNDLLNRIEVNYLTNFTAPRASRFSPLNVWSQG